jgi:hydroxybutyrate-dimer hydrolase
MAALRLSFAHSPLMDKEEAMKQPVPFRLPVPLLLMSVSALFAACGGDRAPLNPNVGQPELVTGQPNLPPTFLAASKSASYDGNTDDLLTAGLGKTGLAGAAPAFADPLNPSPAELRRNAIYNNYRAVLDITAAGGYGSMYGPNVDAKGVVSAGEGKIGGTEYIAYVDDGTGNLNVTLMVQVPANFNPESACIVTGTASGSRGIYGAIGSAGEWGLKNGCAVAYTDKGGGNGLYTFDDDSVNAIDGRRTLRSTAGKGAIFAPILSDAARLAFGSAFPNRVAFKHAHSQQNPEKDWGKNTLQAVELAFYFLNNQFGALSSDGATRYIRLTPSNTIVIASSISNGAGAALLAAEQDMNGLIDGVAATEPQVQPKPTGYTITQGGVAVPGAGKRLLDYSSYAALYQPCIAGVASRCAALVQKGLLEGADLAAQQSSALARMHAYGWLPDSDILQAAHAGTNVLVAATYLNAYGRFSVTDNACGFSFANTDVLGNVAGYTAAQRMASFSTLSGIPGAVIYEPAFGGAKAYTVATSPSTGLVDQALDGFLCLRGMVTGVNPVTNQALAGVDLVTSQRVQTGINEVLASANLHGKPAVIVHGRSDTLIPVNHSSRAYLGANAVVEGSASKLRYIEVTNANHFDAFGAALPQAIVPLHVYLFRALDAVYANLKSGKALPASQVVRTVPRANATETVSSTNVPPIAETAAAGNAIVVSGTTVAVPN